MFARFGKGKRQRETGRSCGRCARGEGSGDPQMTGLGDGVSCDGEVDCC